MVYAHTELAMGLSLPGTIAFRRHMTSCSLMSRSIFSMASYHLCHCNVQLRVLRRLLYCEQPPGWEFQRQPLTVTICFPHGNLCSYERSAGEEGAARLRTAKKEGAQTAPFLETTPACFPIRWGTASR